MLLECSKKCETDLAGVGSVTVSGAPHPVHVPAIWVAGGVEPEKKYFFKFHTFSLFLVTQKTAVPRLSSQTNCVVHGS